MGQNGNGHGDVDDESLSLYGVSSHISMQSFHPMHTLLISTEVEARRLKPGSKAASANSNTKKTSADAEARRQTMIAAAEARDKAHKSKTKTIKHVTKTTLDREKQKQEEAAKQQQQQSQEPLSDASRQAAAAAKQDEAALANQLGYNPYETSKSTAGQARNATTTVQHGNINAVSAGDHLPSVAPPKEAAQEESDNEAMMALPNEAEEALVTVLSSNNTSAISILRKLIVNATTKGQQQQQQQESLAADGAQDDNNDDPSAKFRKVRLSNPKIKAAVVDVPGALDWMMVVGFQLVEDEATQESCLVFPPPPYDEPEWLQSALKRMEQAL